MHVYAHIYESRGQGGPPRRERTRRGAATRLESPGQGGRQDDSDWDGGPLPERSRRDGGLPRRERPLGQSHSTRVFPRDPFPREPVRESPSTRAYLVEPLHENSSGRACPREPIHESPSARALPREPFCESPSARVLPQEPFRESPSARVLPREPFRESPLHCKSSPRQSFAKVSF